MVVKWSSCSPYTPTIRVRKPLKPTFFLENLCLKIIKINKKWQRLAHFLKKPQFITKQCKAEIKHSDWMFQVMWLHSNQSEYFICATLKFVYNIDSRLKLKCLWYKCISGLLSSMSYTTLFVYLSLSLSLSLSLMFV